jgi:serine phosphatase RsbU (regulator of sigma subunit)
MSPILRRLIGREGASRALVSAIVEAIGSAVAIEDSDGRLLYGAAAAEGGMDRFPIVHDVASIGTVTGPAPAAVIAALLQHLVARDAERKALGTEVLHLYREVNLIYAFSEKIAALLDAERVAQLTLQEAHRVIACSHASLMLVDDESGRLSRIAAVGDDVPCLQAVPCGEGIVGAVAVTGVGEIVNDVNLDARRYAEFAGVRALICAPLKVGERVTGVLVVCSAVPMPYTAAELKLLTTLALQTATAIENARLFERTVQAAAERERLMALHQQAELARTKLEAELTLAARIQADLFPAALPRVDGYEFAARSRPARLCGGDYYDALPLTGHAGRSGLLLCVADVAGKGLPAALVMSNAQATIRALLAHADSLADLAGHASELLYATTPPEKYVTAALVELAPDTGALTFVGAGHVDSFLLRASGDVVRLVSTGHPLGLLPPLVPYDRSVHALDGGDCLVLFSDGVPEAQNAEGEEFGEGRLLEVLRSAAPDGAEAAVHRVFEAIDAFVCGAPQYDDITIVVARRAETPA